MGLYPLLTKDEAHDLSPSEQVKLKKKLTPKHFQTLAAQGICGDTYVELAVFGGMVSMSDDKCVSYNSLCFIPLTDFAVAITTPDTCIKMVSVKVIKALKRLGLCELVSLAAPLLNSTPPSLTPIHNRQGASAILCDSDHDKQLFWNRCPRDYPGTKLHSTCCYH